MMNTITWMSRVENEVLVELGISGIWCSLLFFVPFCRKFFMPRLVAVVCAIRTFLEVRTRVPLNGACSKSSKFFARSIYL